MSNYENKLSAGRPSARSNRTATLSSLTDSPAVKRVNFEITADDHAKLKINAARQGKSIKELLTEFVSKLPEY